MQSLLLLVLFSTPLMCQVRRADPPAARQSGISFLAQGPGGTTYLSWIDPLASGGRVLRYSRWTGEASTSGETITQGKNWFVNWADFPALLILADG